MKNVNLETISKKEFVNVFSSIIINIIDENDKKVLKVAKAVEQWAYNNAPINKIPDNNRVIANINSRKKIDTLEKYLLALLYAIPAFNSRKNITYTLEDLLFNVYKSCITSNKFKELYIKGLQNENI